MREMLAGTFLLRSTLLGELSTPGHTTGVGGGGTQAPGGGPLPWSGAHILADLVCLGTGKEQISSCWWALRIFYIVNEGLQGLRFSLPLNRMISHIIFTMAFLAFRDFFFY